MGNIFIKIDNSKLTLVSAFFSKKYKIPNVCRFILKRGKIKYRLLPHENKHKAFKTSCFNDQPISFRKDLPAIVLILESPHDKEYDSKTFAPKAPAQKNTGNLINEKLEKIINNSRKELLKLDKEEYRVIIINPIPHQTSLFHIHKQPLQGIYATLRNNIWKTLWKYDDSYKENFKKIINEVNPEIIINACTRALTESLKLELLKPAFSNYEKFKIRHPSSWNWNENKLTLSTL